MLGAVWERGDDSLRAARRPSKEAALLCARTFNFGAFCSQRYLHTGKMKECITTDTAFPVPCWSLLQPPPASHTLCLSQRQPWLTAHQRCAWQAEGDASRALPPNGSLSSAPSLCQTRLSPGDLILPGLVPGLSLEQAPVCQCRQEGKHALFLMLNINCFSRSLSERAGEGTQESG